MSKQQTLAAAGYTPVPVPAQIRARQGLPFGFDRPEQILEPYCACGRVISSCDGSRRGCAKGGRRGV